ncbi:MAG: histone deacetylase [Deltaproteobacteria bacterium]|jgi:acetoin utilization deacetylase AcuC-like enzyme|nr:histone deacetylase [Deltaproteobacteria bacterium]MBW2500962.1 histone deacetylase [Deltaproteobacteria bacterium]
MSSLAVQVVEDTRYLDHRGPDGHPERPERLQAVAEALDAFRSDIECVTPRSASAEEVLRVHDRRLLEVLEATRGAPPGHLDADTYYGPSSYDTALLAAGGTVELALRVMRGEVRSGLAAVRPPGHHAEAARSMGFCLINNVAVAARAIQAEHGSVRILIYDWDVHHGNGTQHSFEEDPSILYLSTHQFPFYPGTGDFGEVGRGAGIGTTLNVPMPAGCGDAEYIGVMERVVVPAAHHFAPDVILVSCGFDAHGDDPLASMELDLAGYRAMAGTMRRLADELCDGRLVYVLEGGYALSGVREGTRAVLESLVSSDAPEPASPLDLEPGSTLRNLVDRVVAAHGARIPDLGTA